MRQSHILLLLSVSAPFLLSEHLTDQDWKILRTEYFLQKFLDDLSSLPRKFLGRVKSEDLVHSNHLDKRSSKLGRNICTNKEPDQPCCLDEVTVDFQSLGWDFILSPRSLQFSFCRGSCSPLLVRPSLFTHAADQILYVSNSSSCLE